MTHQGGMMRKSLRTKLLVMVGALAVLLIFAGIGQLAAQQTKITVKPPKPPAIECNENEICEDGEYDNSKPYEEQTCPDCAPKDYALLNTGIPFFLGLDAYWNSHIFQFKYDNGSFIDTWVSQDFGNPVTYDFGDYDSNGEMEIIAVVRDSFTEGKGNKKITYYEVSLNVFESGSDGSPSLQRFILEPSTDYWRDLRLVDADNDGFENEIILRNSNSLKIFRWNGSEFVNIWTSPTIFDSMSRFEVGDADGDGENEIVCSIFRGPYALVIDHLGGDNWSDDVITTDPIVVANPDIDFITLQHAIPCDADNDGFSKEIIAGGNNNRLMVWALVDGGYKIVAMSDDLGGFTLGIGCGDFDGDGEDEIVAGTVEGNIPYDTGSLNVFKLISTKNEEGNLEFELQLLYSVTTDFGIYSIKTGDVDGDGWDEVLSSGGVIFSDKGLGLKPVFSSYYLSSPRVK
ncbi:MAG: VCBS repeat-containing protein [Pseudomonadota bacterium]